MTRQLLPIAALLMGSAFLLFAGGANALILALRGASEGFSPVSLGLLGTGWAIGYVLGCLMVPRLVARVGHIRSFSVLCALAGLAVLASLLLIDEWAWIPLRAVSGFCFAGAAMIVEGWLVERSSANSRGTVFGIYTMINLGATTAGQMSLPMIGGIDGHVLFVVAAMFYMLALIPTAVSSSQSPSPLVQARLDIAGLYRNSPVAVVAVFFVGISNSSFGTLAAVYAQGVGMDLQTIALFASIPILAGALAQVPVGLLSDRMDRRLVLVMVAALALAADVVFLAGVYETRFHQLIMVAIFGAAIFAMYPILVAHANDHATPETYILTSGGLLLVFGLGSIIGPVIAGISMAQLGMSGLFAVTASAHVLTIVYAAWRTSQRAPVASADKGVFMAAPIARTSTPQTAVLSPIIEGIEQEGIDIGDNHVSGGDVPLRDEVAGRSS